MDGLANEWGLRIIIGILFFGGVAIIFKTHSGGTGKFVFFIIAFLLCLLFYFFPIVQLVLFVFLIFYTADYFFRANRRGGAYKKAEVIFEGGGIRFGLTLPEAALLLHRNTKQVLALIMIEMLNKGFIKIKDNTNEYQFQVIKELQGLKASYNAQKRMKMRREGAKKLKAVIQNYEETVIELFENNDGESIGKIDFGILETYLKKHLLTRMKGYDVGKSKMYYQSKMEYAFSAASRKLTNRIEGDGFSYVNKWTLLLDDIDQLSQLRKEWYSTPWREGKESFTKWYQGLMNEIQSS